MDRTLLSTFLFLTTLAAGSAYGDGINYCAPGPNNTTIVKKEYLDLAPDAKKAAEAFKKGSAELFKAIEPFQEDILTDGQAFAKLNNSIDQYIQKALELKGQLNTLLLQLPQSYRLVGQAAIRSFLNSASILVELENFVRPGQTGIDVLRFKYAIDLSPAAVERFLDSGEFKSKGTELQAKTVDGKLKYQLSLSPETVYNSLVRGVARSPSINNTSKSYLETVRCILSRGIMSKLAYNRAISRKGDMGNLASAQDQICYRTNPLETVSMVKGEIDIVRNQLIKVRAREVLPAFAKNLDISTIRFMSEAEIIGSMPPLFAQPSLLVPVNLKRKSLGMDIVDQTGFDLALKDISAKIEAEYVKFPAVEKLRLIWHDPKIQARLASLLNNCQFQLKDGSGNALTVDDYVEQITRGDDYMFLASLYREVINTPGDWAQMAPEQLKLEIKNFILSRKTFASLYSISYLLDSLSNQTSADSEALMTAITKDLSFYLRQEFERIWDKSPDLQKWQADLAQKILEKRSETLAYDVQLNAFTLGLIQDSKKIKEIMNPEKPLASLPYNEDALLLSLSGLIKSLGSDNSRRFRLIRDEDDFAKRAQIWSEVKKLVDTETARAGASCDRPGWTKGVSRTVMGWFGSDSAKLEKTANQDCLSLKIVTGAMNIEGRESPRDMSHTVAFLQDFMDLKEFNLAYRKFLASEILAENRILDIPLDSEGNRRFWERVVEIDNADKLKPEVLQNLQKSVESLESSLAMVTHAEKVEDLQFFIKRSSLINSILGEKKVGKAVAVLSPLNGPRNTGTALSNDELGFVFPNLVKYHNQLQDRMLLFEDYDRDVWNALFYAHYKVLRIVIGGWILKWGFSKLPAFTGLPSLGSLIGQKGWLLKDAIGGHADFTLWLMAASLGLNERDLNEYNTELGNIGSLWLSEGAQIETPSSPFPLISRQSFIQQDLFFKDAIKNAESERYQTLAWMSVPLVLGQGPKVFDATIKALRLRKEAKLSGSGYLGQLKAEASLKNSVQNRIKSVLADLAILGRPLSIDVSSLRAGLEQARKSAKSNYQVRAAEQAYERIVTSFGRDIQAYADMPLLQQAYARALYDGRGSVRQLEELSEESNRLSRSLKGAK